MLSPHPDLVGPNNCPSNAVAARRSSAALDGQSKVQMNLKQLRKQLGTNLRLRPLPKRINLEGEHLPDSDDHWQLEKILEDPSTVQLSNTHTGHVLKLQPDNVREFESCTVDGSSRIFSNCQTGINCEASSPVKMVYRNMP